jgi:HEAT repeat protein
MSDSGVDGEVWVWQGRELGVDERLLLQLICEHDEKAPLDALVFALGRFGGGASVPILHDLLLSPDPWVRYQAAVVLGDWRIHSATKRLCKLAVEDGSSNVRGSAVYALSHIGGNDALGGVRAALADSSAFVVLQAKQAILRMEHKRKVEGPEASVE